MQHPSGADRPSEITAVSVATTPLAAGAPAQCLPGALSDRGESSATAAAAAAVTAAPAATAAAAPAATGSGAGGASTAAIGDARSASDTYPLAAVAYSSHATVTTADAMPTSVFVIAAAASVSAAVTPAKLCSATSVSAAGTKSPLAAPIASAAMVTVAAVALAFAATARRSAACKH